MANNGLRANNSSQVTMSNGTVHNYLYAYDSTQVTISGGSVDGVYARQNSRVTISGGLVNGYVYVGESSQVTMSGGTIGTTLRLGTSGELIIDGYNFAVDGSPVGFGEITSILGGAYDDEPFRLLTGILASGDVISNQFKIGENASINLIPEPATLALLLIGSLVLLKRRPWKLSNADH